MTWHAPGRPPWQAAGAGSGDAAAIDPYDDNEGFEEAKQRLLQRFEEWLGAEGASGPVQAQELAADAGVALDWKCGYGDGDLASWPTRDVAELLLDWCPRKLSVPQEECHRLPVALGAFLEFLDAAGLRTHRRVRWSRCSVPSRPSRRTTCRPWATPRSSAWPRPSSGRPRPTAWTSATRTASRHGWPSSTPGPRTSGGA